MASAFREEHHDSDVDSYHATTHQATTARVSGGNGNGVGRGNQHAGQQLDGDDMPPLENASTADTDDHIISKNSPRRELTREKLATAARNSRAWSAAHIKHKWKWYLLGTIIFLAILLPIVFKVALPAIVQLIVNQQTLPIRSGYLNVVAPDTIKLTLDSSFRIPPGLKATTNEFVLQLYDKSAPKFSPFLSVEVPPLTLNGGNTNFSIKDQTQKVTDMESLTSWFGGFYDAPGSYDLSVRGTQAVISLGALKSEPRLDKTITVQGLNKLQGLQMKKLEFLFPTQNGINIKGDLMLPNLSPLALSFGDIELNIASGDLKVGHLTLSDITLQPGNQTQSFEGFLDLNAVIGNLSTFLGSQSLPLGEGVLQLNATATSVIVNDQHITFLEEILGKRPLAVNISVVTLLSDLLSGLLKGGGAITGSGPNNGTDFIDKLSGVFANQTLLSGIAGHWTKHKTRSLGDGGLESRSLLGDNAMWNMVKLGLKLKAMQAKK
ncbi:hypothetical protein ISF_02041 [Cordyceps fumosorosea ARSEF 2679]|uniref:Uncharacterized protein n=1 Tax=Cordyceps fumosorosea (strain ARSEF 2679) TaxID=1081104 RepID=A0A168CKM0_CORFA|nr:hypothetical protein ISF_02041 [Cordyceps fumosorosea ARSEF 2679]OAA71490.1 hypothetical protein ISF_02041 [Cordyceps fumosorosea ARSEF 2679]